MTSSAKCRIELLDVDNEGLSAYVTKTIFCSPYSDKDANNSDTLNSDVDYLLPTDLLPHSVDLDKPPHIKSASPLAGLSGFVIRVHRFQRCAERQCSS